MTDTEKLKIEMYRTLSDNQATVRGLLQELIDEGVYFSLRQGPYSDGLKWQATYKNHHAIGATKGQALVELGLALDRLL